MGDASLTDVRPVYCPHCGYDLRAATGPVCSECGARVGAGMPSRLPWRQRRWRGATPAWLATAWLALRRPSLLVQEMQWRVPSRDPRRFMHVSIVLASALLTGLFAVAFAFRGAQWLALLPKIDEINYETLRLENFSQATLPLFALWDSWFILIPFFLTTLFTLELTQTIYRLILAMASGDSCHRRRLGRVTMYLSALMVWTAACVGLFSIATMIQAERPDLPNYLAGTLTAVQFILPLLLLTMFLGPSISIIARTSRPTRAWKWFYWLLMLWFVLLCKVLFVLEDDTLLHGGPDYQGIGVVLALFLPITFVGLMFSLILWKWRWQALRITYLLVVYPVLHLLVFIGIAFVVFWTCGFVALAVGSMIYRA